MTLPFISPHPRRIWRALETATVRVVGLARFRGLLAHRRAASIELDAFYWALGGVLPETRIAPVPRPMIGWGGSLPGLRASR